MYSRTCLKWRATLLLWLRLNSFKTISSIELIEFIIWVPMYQLKQVFLERSALYWLGTGHLEESGSWPLGRDMFLSHSPQPVLSQSVRASHQQLPSPVLVLLLQVAVLECPLQDANTRMQSLKILTAQTSGTRLRFPSGIQMIALHDVWPWCGCRSCRISPASKGKWRARN